VAVAPAGKAADWRQLLFGAEAESRRGAEGWDVERRLSVIAAPSALLEMAQMHASTSVFIDFFIMSVFR
jgi:hypothetical protein